MQAVAAFVVEGSLDKLKMVPDAPRWRQVLADGAMMAAFLLEQSVLRVGAQQGAVNQEPGLGTCERQKNEAC